MTPVLKDESFEISSSGNISITASYPYPYGITIPSSAVSTNVPLGTGPTTAYINWPAIGPGKILLNDPGILDQLISKMITLYKPEDPLIICLDNDFTPQQINELAKYLEIKGIRGVIISGARAGTGRPIYHPIKEGRERIDILARIAEVWERRPDMHLTDLLEWWDGSHMEDDDFAAAVDVYFNKIMEE